jgi:preprotein translocase subunit SecA
MRIFAKEWVSNLLQRLGMEEGVPIESGLITRRIEAAQKAVEAQNFESRKHLLEYDDVMNKQREAVYGLRRQMLEGVDQKDLILEDYVSGMLGDLMHLYMPEGKHVDEWDYEGLKKEIMSRFVVDIGSEKELASLNRQELGDKVFEMLRARYEEKEKMLGTDAMRYHERMLMLSVLDQLWKEHLLNMDHLKEGIGLRGYGQKDPLVEYKRESFEMFEEMMQRFQEDTARYLFSMQIVSERGGRQEPVTIDPDAVHTGGNGARPPATSLDEIEKEFQRKKRKELEQARMAGAGAMEEVVQVRRGGDKVGRNDPCPCGSGKKYKKCHGAAA